MEIFCELINNNLKIEVNGESLIVDVPDSFYSKNIEDPKRIEFLNNCFDFVEKENFKRSAWKRILTSPLANTVYFRTDLTEQPDLENLIGFSENILTGRKTKIYTSNSLSYDELVSKTNDFAVDIIDDINKKYIHENKVGDAAIKIRRIQQSLIIGLSLIISLVFTNSLEINLEEAPELKYPQAFWIFLLSLLASNVWIQYSNMKILPKAIFWGFFGSFIATLLVSRGITEKIIELTKISNQLIWMEFFVQSILYFIWNEKVAVYFGTRNGQINK